MTSFFQSAIWSISSHGTVIKWHFWNREIKLVQKHTFYVPRYRFENLTLCDPGLTWTFSFIDFLGSDCKMASIFEFYVQKCLENMCRMPDFFFYSVTFRDLLWPDLDPDPCLVWHLCSPGIFSGPLMLLWVSFEQKQSILPVLGFIIYVETSKFGLWPDSDLKLKILILFSIVGFFNVTDKNRFTFQLFVVVFLISERCFVARVIGIFRLNFSMSRAEAPRPNLQALLWGGARYNRKKCQAG